MQLQDLRSSSALHLPSTRQRNDGLHENHIETPLSSLIFPDQCSKSVPTRAGLGKLFKTAALAALFTAGAIALPMFDTPTAFAQSATLQQPVGTWGTSTGSASYIRIRPGVQTPVVAKIPRGTRLMVWGTFNGWYRVETTDRKFGWVYHTLVNVPNASKLQELSHAKAVEASNRTGDQLLYGSVDQLKKYYATYKAPGAKLGLQKLGVDIDAKTPSVQKVAAKPQPNTPPLPRDVALAPTQPKVIHVAEAEKKAPVPARLTSRKATSRPAAPVQAPAPTPAAQEAASVEPMSPASLPQISAVDIMEARRRHIENQLASRHKTRPSVAASPNSAIKTAPAAKPVPTPQAKVKPASFEAGEESETEVLGEPYIQASAQQKPSRGGSPRDYAKKAPLGNAVAQQALSYRGMPYISGASSPNRGFDCSGLVYFLLRSRGYNPPRTAAGFASYGKPVAKKDLKPGDLVLFANTYKRGVSHIGVYVGNNNFVHAANRRTGVKTDSLSSPYYSKKYYGARRVQ